MIEHFIVSGSSYKKGTRIVFHKAYMEGLDQNEIVSFISELQKSKGLKYSVHYIATSSSEWESVVAYDSFFEGMEVYEKLTDFIDTLKNDVVIKGIDIAKYIIPKYQVSDHLALEKLVYFCYAEYLCKSRKRLFSDQVMAFDMGPVVDSVYAEYRGQSEIRSEISLDAARSRLMSLPDGIEILNTIDSTLKKYGDYSGLELMGLTHAKGSPWMYAYKPFSFRKEIPDEFILKYHAAEAIAEAI